MLARDRILSARGLDTVVRRMRATEGEMASADAETHEKAMRRYPRLEAEFQAAGGYAAESEAASFASSLGLPDRVLEQPLRTLSGGQRRRVELSRILFASTGSDATLLLDEPTNHLDADSIVWLRDYLGSYKGGLVVISHDVGLLEHTVTRVFHLDANRAELDIYNVGWKAYLLQRETDERRRKRERANVEKQASVLKAQADRMRYKATKARAAQSMDKRAAKLLSGLDEVRRTDRVAKLRFPEPAPCGKTPLTAEGLSKSYGSLEVFTDVDLAIDRGSRVVILGLNGAGKTTLMRLLAGVEEPDTGEVAARPRAQDRLLRAGARDPRPRAHRAAEHAQRGAGPGRRRGTPGAGLVPVLRRRRGQAGRRALRRGEDPARAGHPGGVQRERADARRADQQPRPGQPRGDPRRAAQLRRRRRAGHPRRGRGRGAGRRSG